MKKKKYVWKRLCAITLSSALLVSVVPTLYLPIGEVFAAEETEVIPSTEETQEEQISEAAAASMSEETEVAPSTEETQTDSVAKEEEQTSEAAAASIPDETEVDESVEEYAAAAPKAGDVAIDSTNFPDANFRRDVQEKIDQNKDGVLSKSEIDNCTHIDFLSEVKNLKGIEFFTNLTSLDCSNNQLGNLDVSKNIALTSLDCSNNRLSNLDVSKNIALTSLQCYNNQLISLDVSKNIALISLVCFGNNLTSLDLSQNIHLTFAEVWEQGSRGYSLSNTNQFDLSTLPNFDVSRVTSLRNGSISGNILTVDPGESIVKYKYDSNAPLPLLQGKEFSFWLAFDKTDDSQTTPGIPTSGTGISYQTHVQTYGWQNPVSNGKVAGTSGQAKRLEGIKVSVSGNPNLGVQYTTHVQSYGWLPWAGNGEFSGTEGEAKRLEAIKIQLTGADKDNYDVYYRVHAQSYGWLNWAKNGAAAGTAGLSKRLEAIQIQIVEKGKAINTKAEGISSARNEAYIANSGNAPVVGGADAPNVSYKTHVQTYGWQGLKHNGQMSGTSGQAKRLEGICINLSNLPYSGGITYQTHVQTYGWQGWKSNGTMSGTSGQAKRLEAIEIKLTGEMEKHYDVYYRVHAQTYGWMGWAKNGASAGTAGLSKRLEGIQIVLVPKGNAAPANNYGGIVSVRTSAFVQK